MFQSRRTDNRRIETASGDEELHCRGVIGNVAENGPAGGARKDSGITEEHGDAQDQEAIHARRLDRLGRMKPPNSRPPKYRGSSAADRGAAGRRAAKSEKR
jgi:hypothetical protein